MPTIEDITTSTSSSTTTLSVSLGTFTTGNLLVASIAQKQNTALPSMTLPSGWTSAYTNNAIDGGGYQLVHNVYYRESDGTEGSTLSVTSSDDGESVHQLFEISGHNGLNTSATNFTEGQFTTSPTVGAVTTDEADELLIVILSNTNVADPFEPTVPTGMTLGTHLNNGITLAMSSAYETIASAGSTGARTWSDGDSSVSNCVMFAISPSAGGGSSALPLINAYYS